MNRLTSTFLVFALALTLQGCSLFCKNPDLRAEIKAVRKNIKQLRKDYLPVKDKDGKVIAPSPLKPFDDPKLNKKALKTSLNLFDETDSLLGTMLKAYESSGDEADGENAEDKDAKTGE